MTRETMPSDIFDEQAVRYDRWYDTPTGSAVFTAEKRGLRITSESPA